MCEYYIYIYREREREREKERESDRVVSKTLISVFRKCPVDLKLYHFVDK